MISKTTPIALVLPTQKEVDLFVTVLGKLGHRNVVPFKSASEALESASRQQFPMFIVRQEMPDMPGIVLVQKLRETGNYGAETYLFVAETIDSGILNLLYEYDLTYVLVKVNRDTVQQKLEHVFASEATLSEFEQTFRQARGAYYNGSIEVAQELCTKLLAHKPDSEKGLLLAGDIQLKRNNTEPAKELFQKALIANPKSAAATHKLAQIHMLKGEFRPAAQLLDQLADINPQHIKILENAGLSTFKSEMTERAEHHMQKLHNIDKSNTVASEVSAEIMIKKGDFNGIVATLKKGMTDKEMIQFLNNAGVKLSQGNDIQGALDLYNAASEQLGEKSPFLYAIYYNMAVAYRKLGKLKQARAYIMKSVAAKPDFERGQGLLKEIEAETKAAA